MRVNAADNVSVSVVSFYPKQGLTSCSINYKHLESDIFIRINSHAPIHLLLFQTQHKPRQAKAMNIIRKEEHTRLHQAATYHSIHGAEPAK